MADIRKLALLRNPIFCNSNHKLQEQDTDISKLYLIFIFIYISIGFILIAFFHLPNGFSLQTEILNSVQYLNSCRIVLSSATNHDPYYCAILPISLLLYHSYVQIHVYFLKIYLKGGWKKLNGREEEGAHLLKIYHGSSLK